MSKRSFRTALAIVVTSLVVVTVVFVVMYRKAMAYPVTAMSGDGSEVEVTIDRGMSLSAVAKRLHERGIVDNPTWFRLYAMNEGATTKVRSGTYKLRNNWSPESVLGELVKGVEEVNVSVTIREGLHFREVFQAIEEKGVAKAADLEKLAWDSKFLESLAIEGDTIEGYLFPDTYRFRVPTPPKKVLQTLVEQHRKVWSEVRRNHERSLERVKSKLKWSDRDVLTMASIVEKEAVLASEQARIAQVFINRLTDPAFNPKRLETDPTIRYGCTIVRDPSDLSKGCKEWDPSQRLRRAQLDDTDNPYNTYRHEGLPPGPICSPGRGALEAVAKPDGSKYFFFVAHKDGTGAHVFSRTKAQHDKAVREYVSGSR